MKIIRSFQHIMASVADQVGEYPPGELTYDRVQTELDEFVAELVR